MSEHHQAMPSEILAAASAWLARRDRGLSAAEQDDYMQWLTADSRHTEALQQHAAALERMMQLYEWTPANDTEPNPDLFAPSIARNRRWARWMSASVAAAAAIALMVVFTRPAVEKNVFASAPKSYLRVNDRVALPDGSRVELRDGTQLVVQYSATERRVKLTGGEAHFSVWKDKTRPFVVDAAGIEVRAVGTAFNVRLGARDVHVLVTEGRVSVEQPALNGTVEAAEVAVGEQAIVLRAPEIAPRIAPVTADDIARELAWQAPRLEFNETPLAEAVAEFNRLNRHQIEIGDRDLGALPIGGTFRPDNVDGFIRLLSTDPSLGVIAEPRSESRTVLRRAR